MEYIKRHWIISTITLLVILLLGFQYMFLGTGLNIISIIFMFVFVAVVFAVISLPVYVSKVALKALLKRNWGRAPSVFVSTLVMGAVILALIFIFVSLTNNLPDGGGFGMAYLMMVLSLPLFFAVVINYFNMIFYRIDPTVPTTLKTVTTIGGVSSDNKFFQGVIFFVTYGLIFIVVAGITTSLLFVLLKMTQEPSGILEIIDGKEYFYPYE